MLSLGLSSPTRPLRQLLRRSPDLRLLLGAGLVSMTGDRILSVGLAYSIYAITGSTLASAAALLSAFVPQVVVGSVAGVFVDRWDRKQTMVVTNVLLALGLVPLLVSGADHIWLIYVVLAVQSCLEVFFSPAEQAFLPRVVVSDDLVTANGLNGQVANVARLVGAGLGGVVAATGGIRAVAVADALSFVVAAVLVARIRTDGRAAGSGHVIGAGVASGDRSGDVDVAAAAGLARGRFAALAEEWREGLTTVTTNRVLTTLVLSLLITSTGEGIMGTLFVPYVWHVLHAGNEVYGLIAGVQAIGGIAGGFVVAVVAHRWSSVTMVWVGSVLFGLVDLAIFVYPLVWVSPWPAAVGMVVVGLPGAVLIAGTMTLLQRNTSDEHRGRVFSLMSLAQAVSVVVGSTLAGFLGGPVGIVPVLVLQGMGYVVAGLLVLVRLGSRQGSLDLSPTRS
jgi:predicted MFS family arabinose efflux permease